MTHAEAAEQLLDERNNNIAEWIGRLPDNYWFQIAARERAEKIELLEAAKNLIAALDDCPGNFNYPATIEDAIRAAIAKAEGKQ